MKNLPTAPTRTPTGALALTLVCGALAFGCVKTLPTETPPSVSPVTMGSGEWRVTDRILVITDASGTMYENETFPTAKAMTQAFVASLPPRGAPAENPDTYSVGSVGFSGDDRDGVALGSFDRNALVNEANELQIMGSVDGTGGTTPMHRVLEEAAVQLGGSPGRSALVVISDGLADDPELALAAGAVLVESVPDPVCIHAIQTGQDPDGTEFLTALTGLTDCGVLRNADSLRSSAQFSQFTKAVVGGTAPPPSLPPVAAAGPCDSVVRLNGIEFGFDRDDIDPGSQVVLDVAVDQLRECGDIRVHIDGHTDSTGPEAYNEGLSRRRAGSAERYFIDAGISGRRLETRGFGESRPLESNDTRDGRARNRRVELNPIR